METIHKEHPQSPQEGVRTFRMEPLSRGNQIVAPHWLLLPSSKNIPGISQILLGVSLEFQRQLGSTLPCAPQVPDGKSYAEPHTQVTAAETVSTDLAGSLQTGSVGHRKDGKQWLPPRAPFPSQGPESLMNLSIKTTCTDGPETSRSV